MIDDGSHKDQRASKNPVAQKGRTSQHHPWFFGIRFALLMVAWDVYYIPVAFLIILPKTHPGYRPENALFWDMLRAFKPPAWAAQVIVEGDAAYRSQAPIALVKHRDRADASRAWNFVCALSRTWKTVDEKTVKNLVQHLPRCYDQRTWIPSLSTGQKRKTSWVDAKRLCLRDMGDVTLVLSKTGRNVSPEKTKLLVTNLPHGTARQVGWLYQNRWSVELINRDVKSALGLGDHQVRGPQERLEKSFGLAILAYLFVCRLGHYEITPGRPWSVSGLQHRLQLRVMTNQVEHNVKGKLALRT